MKFFGQSVGHSSRKSMINRVLGVVGLSSLLISIIIALPLVTQAQTGDSEKSVTPTPPPPPPPLNPPLKGPTYNRKPLQSVDLDKLRANITAQPFEPNVRIHLGDSISPEGAKTTAKGNDSVDIEKPGLDRDTRNTSPTMIGPRLNTKVAHQARALAANDWVLKGEEFFDGTFGEGVSCGVQGGPPYWDMDDFGPDGKDRTWGQDDFYVYSGTGSAWPASGGADALDPEMYYYPNRLNSWMTCGPFDFSQAADIYVDFFLWLDTELNYDWLAFGASVDNFTFDVYLWSGYSGGDWVYEPFFLSSYAGHSQVWLAWIFESDFSNPDPYEGPWIDHISIWAYEPPEADPDGNLVENGSFEENTQGWNANYYEPRLRTKPDPRESGVISPTNITAVDGMTVAVMYADGEQNDFLYQTDITIPDQTTDIEFTFWFAITSLEENFDTDWFCASLTDPDFNYLIVDLGCTDARDAWQGQWQEVVYVLTEEEVDQVSQEGALNLVFELYNRGPLGTSTFAWIDAVQLYAIGGEAGTPIDSNEPNDEVNNSEDEATLIACNSTTSATIGDVIDSYGDVDWYRLDNVPTGPLIIDINAKTQSPPSQLDSVVYLFDASVTQDEPDNPTAVPIAFNDDDGATYDSYFSYTVTSANQSFYILVESYSGYGSSDSYYDLNVTCNDQNNQPPEQPTTLTGLPDTWTVMLYLNAEDPNFAAPLLQYIEDLQQVLVGKTNYLSITVLYDGPENGDTVRMLLDPTGTYTNGVNQWEMSEQNMGDRDTLAAFLTWSMDNYPAENYYASFDDHGHGVYGISWDTTNDNDELTPPEVYSALKEATHNGERQIDIVDSEACLTGLAEHAYDVSDWAKYVVFSQQINWTLDTYPTYFANLQASDTPEQLGQHIVASVHALANDAGRPHTISLVDTSQMDDVKAAITALGAELSNAGNGDAARRDVVNTMRKQAQAFAGDVDATNPNLADYIDLKDLASKAAQAGLINTGLAQTIGHAVDDAVIAEEHASGTVDEFTWNHKGATGLSLYYPAGNASSAFSDYTQGRLYQMTEDGGWDEFLTWAVIEAGSSVGNGIGGDGDRKGMLGSRFLQPKQGSDVTSSIETTVDSDGVDSTIEDGAPNGGDGNNDGVADSEQDHVASLQNVNGDYVTLVAPDGLALVGVEALANPDADSTPHYLTFPQGFFNFNVDGLLSGQSIEITLILHTGDVPTAYWKYGPTTHNSNNHWYPFMFDGTTGAVISGQTITLYFVDGQRGDDDLSANGIIVDPGAPAEQQPVIYLPLAVK